MADDYQWDLFLSHASADKPIVERMADALQKAGLTVWLDKWAIKGGDSIAGKIEEGLEGSRRLIVFMSPASSGSDWVTMEADVMFFRKHENVEREIIPVLLKDCKIRLLLTPKKYIDFRTPNADAWRELLKACGANTVDFPYPFDTPFFPPVAPPPPTSKIHLHHLPTTGGQLFGREGPLRDLDLAWDSPEWRIWILVAAGGVGKTGLVLRWLEQMSLRHFAGAAWVFGWSFYSQGTQEDRQASSEPFLAAALKFFGEDHAAYSTARAKGERLADLVGEKRGLLVLDGLEPLQYPPGEAMLGRLRDAGMEALLKGLAWHNPGLCVVTTRVPVSELAGKQVVRQNTLDHLTTEAGAALLKSYNLKATQKELEQASTEYDGHALALNLLGSYLRAAHGGEIRKRDKIASLANEKALGSHAKKVMVSYEIWLQARPELGLLYLMGLFDRPAEAGEIQAVLAKPAIDGLTDRLPDFGSEAWNNAVTALSDLRLLAPVSDNPKNALECHPLVREYFGEQLKKKYPKAWREANRRLYDYFRAIPTEDQPDTIEALLPLYRAISHGCQAGLHQQALDDVYWERIARGSNYAIKQLMAFGLEQGAMAAFFEQPWSRPAVGLSESDQSWVLNMAASLLCATGRPQEAMQPEEMVLGMDFQQQSWKNAATAAHNLSQSSLICVDLSQAIAYAELAVALAEASGDAFGQMSFRTTHADALHQAGLLAEAETLFQEAEARQQKGQPDYPRLYSLWGYRYCDLLLTQKQYQAVWERAKYALKITTKEKWLFDIALDQLTLGQASIGLENWAEAEQWLNQAVDGLWQAGRQEFISRGLIARAGFYRLQKKWAQAGRDLEEAKEISQRGGMLYYEIPIHLEESQLALAQRKKSQAKPPLDLAENRIQKTGLFRFAPLADQIRRELGEKPRSWDRARIQGEIRQAKEKLFKKYPPPKTA